MNAQPRTIVLALIASVVIHAALALGVYDLPLGRVDPEFLQSEQLYRVYRDIDDAIIDDTAAGDVMAASDESTLAFDLAQMSLALLDQASPVDPPIDPARQVELREQPDERALDAVEEVPVTLPDSISEALIGPPPEYGIVIGAAVETVAGAGVGTHVAPGSGAARAQELLKDAGFVTGHDRLPPARSHVIEFPPADQRIMDVPPASPAIDFAAIALENTTKLAIPEHLDDDFDYQLTVFNDARARSAPMNYFQIDISARRSLTKLPTMPKDVVFLIDVSGSVPQMWVDQIFAGVRESLSSLNQADRFNIVLFNEQVASLSAQGSVPASEANLVAARTFISDFKSQGWTDVNRAMSRLLVRDVAVERVYNLILISDGLPTRGVTDTRELINLITRDNDFASSIYCLGVGQRQNRELLDFLSYRNKGVSLYVSDHTEAAAAIRNLVSRIRYPIMKNVRLDTVGLDSQEVYPLNLPNLHQGERFQIFGTFAGAEPFTMRIAGGNGEKALDFSNTFDLGSAPQGESQIAKDWAFWKLHHLYSRIIQEGERKSIMDEIKQLQRRYGLKTLY